MRKGSKTKGRKPKRNRSTCMMCKFDKHRGNGKERGADQQSAIAAELCGMKIERYPAKWSEYGRAAGPIRNKEMLNAKPNIVWAFHDDLENSKGTANMMAQATTAGISTIHFAHTLSAT
jgi:hypothetical protein